MITDLRVKTVDFLRYCSNNMIMPCERDIDDYFGKDLTEEERIYFICYCFYYYHHWNEKNFDINLDVKANKVSHIWNKVVPTKIDKQ